MKLGKPPQVLICFASVSISGAGGRAHLTENYDTVSEIHLPRSQHGVSLSYVAGLFLYT